MISLETDIARGLNSANKKLIERLFKRPPPSDVTYDEVKRLLEAIGAQVRESGGGSHFYASLNGIRIQVTRPHSKRGQPSMDKGFVKDLCEYFLDLGIVSKTDE